jgi:hypothetical protein
LCIIVDQRVEELEELRALSGEKIFSPIQVVERGVRKRKVSEKERGRNENPPPRLIAQVRRLREVLLQNQVRNAFVSVVGMLARIVIMIIAPVFFDRKSALIV